MESILAGRKADTIYMVHGCCECGRYNDQTKELYDDGFENDKSIERYAAQFAQVYSRPSTQFGPYFLVSKGLNTFYVSISSIICRNYIHVDTF